MEYQCVNLTRCLEKIETGGRPKGGALNNSNGILIIGAEHLGDNGELRLINKKFIPESYFANMRQGIIQDEDILIVKDGATTGKTVFISSTNSLGKAAINEHVFLIRTDKKLLLPKFAFYYLISTKGKKQILSNFKGAAQGGISRSFAKYVKFNLPPLSEQKRIVELLDQADEIRKLRKQATEKAEKIIPALFYKMFGDIKNNTLGFTKKKIGEVLKVKSGKSLTSAMMKKDGQYPVYGGNGINGYHNLYMFEERKIVIGRFGAYCGNVFYSLPKCWISDNALYVSEKTDELTDEFLVYQLKTLNLNQYAGRAGQPLLSGSRIYPIEIIIPNKNLQDKFVLRLKKFENTTELLKESEKKVNNLFEVILSKAFDGSLTANWRRAHMKELLEEMEEQKKYLEKINLR